MNLHILLFRVCVRCACVFDEKTKNKMRLHGRSELKPVFDDGAPIMPMQSADDDFFRYHQPFILHPQIAEQSGQPEKNEE